MFTIMLMITIQQEKGNFEFDDMIDDFMTNKKFQAIIKEFFIRCRKLNLLYLSHNLIFLFQKKLD